jgi:outer membrane protein OmpA-like peptidoglycan-associated protein
MKRWVVGLVSIAGAVAATLALRAAAQPAEVDPDSPGIHAKAREALSRAQKPAMNGESRELKAETRPIAGMNLGVGGAGMNRGVAGMNLGVEGKAVDVSGLLRDLNAEVRGKEVRIALSADVLFDFDKADLKPEAQASLDKVAAVLKSYPKATATIEGHTDGKGDGNYNQKLSERRAESVRKWLAAHGATLPMTTRGMGPKKPVAPNAKPDGTDDPQGRQKNRRVEIVVKRA